MTALDPLTGTCPTCESGPGVGCHTAGGQPCPPHQARKGVVRGGITQEVRRYSKLIGDEIAKLHPGAISRDDLQAAHQAALVRFDYGENPPDP